MLKHAASFALAAFSLAFAAAPARADSVGFAGFAHGAETVTFTVSSPNVAASSTVWAGGFETSLNGGPSFTTYCVDLYQHIAFGGPAYTDYTPVGGAHVFANANAYADLSRLFAYAGPIADAVHEAAFQIAVWEIAYETGSSYDLAHGSATFSGGSASSSGSLALASNWLSHLGSVRGGPTIGALDSPTHQDMIYAPIPEPETYVMLAAGLMGMTMMRRRMARSSRR